MMSFFSPWALFGLLLLAVPIVIHIFKPRKTRRTTFTNLRWLRESQHKLTRRIQWHQILLFLFRAMLVVLLVLVLARPVLNLFGGNTPVERLIILDRSQTMNYLEPGEETAFERGRALAEVELAATGPGDRSTVLLASQSPKALGPLSEDPRACAAALRDAQPVLQDGDLGAVLPIIRSMLGTRREGAKVEIIFISNNLQRSWSQNAISNFMAGETADLTVRLVDVAPEKMENAWIASASLVEGEGTRPPTIRVETGWAGDGEVERSVYLTGLRDLPELSATGMLKPGQLTPLEITLPADYKIGSGIARLELRPDDALPEDNRFFYNSNVSSLARVLVVESETTQVKALQPGLHLRAALETLAQAQKEGLQVQVVSPKDLSPEEIAQASLLILIEPDGLSEENLLAIQDRVRTGCGLAIFLGPGVSLNFFNDKLHDAANPAAGLSPVALSTMLVNQDGQAERFASIDWSHPLLTNLFDPTYNDLAQTRLHGYFRLGPLPDDATVQVLAKIGDSIPAILESDYGAGKVVIFNTTANDAWSDLPRRPSFIPLIDRLITHLSGGVGRSEFLVGEHIAVPIGPFEEAPEVGVTGPSGERLHPTLHRTGGQFFLRLDPVEVPGIYQIGIAGVEGTQEFIVQTSRGDSSLVRMEPNLLEQWWLPAKFETVARENLSAGETASGKRRVHLSPWLAALACLILLGEMALVHWLCPRMDPTLAESHVPGSGLLPRRGGSHEN